MLRVWTYLTLDAFGNPIAADCSYDLAIADFDATMGNNNNITPMRDGLSVLVYDTKKLFEVSGILMILAASIDQKSRATMAGDYRYIGNNLYNHYRNHLPIVVMHYGTNGVTQKAYACQLVGIPDDFSGQAIDDDMSMMHFLRVNRQRITNFNVHIWISGIYYDVDDFSSIVWEDRSGGSS